MFLEGAAMGLTPGEYVFACDECDGDGSVQVIQVIEGDDDDEAELVWSRCDDCSGEGTVVYDEVEAAEAISYGSTPLRTS
jgi:DnaJ-class molecular chaperone